MPMSAIRAAAVTNTARVAGATGQLINGLQSLRIVTAVILGTKLHKYGEIEVHCKGKRAQAYILAVGVFYFILLLSENTFFVSDITIQKFPVWGE